MKLKRRTRYYVLRFVRLKANPHQVALGVTLGFIPNWFPTFGLGPILSMGLAKLSKGNVFAAALGGIVGVPLWPVLFWLNYQIGGLFHDKPSQVDEIEEVEYIEAINDTVESIQTGSEQFLTGAIMNILVSSVILYILTFVLFSKYRRRQGHNL
ncbi:DUF2062 domain-containing protein [Mesobacillus maritimus]|uniref:DUF2062 domain-containing protein n=1 Tax=Mesobacillus maritimus TaxID=1643336 RepID=A0ABS7K545_9BACI|nr:DUF2062 domain-containing protein [Mesobacillus maritimus]MBY0097367.1 DUF2062 domain-containing protein [Mesobacillus maritimus]